MLDWPGRCIIYFSASANLGDGAISTELYAVKQKMDKLAMAHI